MSVPVSDPMGREHAQLRTDAMARRRLAAKTDATLHAFGKEAFAILDRMRADGATETDCRSYLAGVLKQIAPGTDCGCPRCRWLCMACEDTGAVMVRRPARIYGGAMVDTVEPCHCAKGQRFMPKTPEPDDYTQAGRTRKPQPKSFSQVGR